MCSAPLLMMGRTCTIFEDEQLRPLKEGIMPPSFSTDTREEQMKEDGGYHANIRQLKSGH